VVKIERTWWGEDGLMAEAVIPRDSPEAKAIHEGVLAHFSIDRDGFITQNVDLEPVPPPSLEEMSDLARAVRKAVDKAVAEAVDNRTYVVPTQQVADSVRKAIGFNADVVISPGCPADSVFVVPRTDEFFNDTVKDVIRIQSSLRDLGFGIRTSMPDLGPGVVID